VRDWLEAAALLIIALVLFSAFASWVVL